MWKARIDSFLCKAQFWAVYIIKGTYWAVVKLRPALSAQLSSSPCLKAGSFHGYNCMGRLIYRDTLSLVNSTTDEGKIQLWSHLSALKALRKSNRIKYTTENLKKHYENHHFKQPFCEYCSKLKNKSRVFHMLS